MEFGQKLAERAWRTTQVQPQEVDFWKSIVQNLGNEEVIPIISGNIRLEQIFRNLPKESTVKNDGEGRQLTVVETLVRYWAQSIGYPMEDDYNLARVFQYELVRKLKELIDEKVTERDIDKITRNEIVHFLKNSLLTLASDDPDYLDVVEGLSYQMQELSFSEMARQLDYPRYDKTRRCAASLTRLGVEIRVGARLEHIDGDGVRVRTGDVVERIGARTVLWAAGVRANPLGRRLADGLGLTTDRAGRIAVEPNLSVPGHPGVFVIGDLALSVGRDGVPLPGVAPVAMQQGRYVGRVIRARLAGHPVAPFRYVNKGELATIGRAPAVANFGKLRLSGYPAWLLWLFVHLMYLVDFENRLLVFVQWAWNYVTWNRGARLIAHGWVAGGRSRRESP